MRAWAEMFDAFLARARRTPRRTPSATTSTTSTASPATTACATCSPPAASSCPRATRRPARRGDRVRAGQPQERRCSTRCSPATASTPTPARSRCSTRCDARGHRSPSSRRRANAPACSRAAGLADRFDIVVDGGVASRAGLPGKPAPDTFVHAAGQPRRPADRAVVVEDAVSGVAGRSAPALRAGDRGRPRGGRRHAARRGRRPRRRGPGGARRRRGVDEQLHGASTRLPARRPAGPARASRSTRGGWSSATTTPRDLGPHRDPVRGRQRLPRHARQRRGGPRDASRTAPSSTASTRPGRSSTPRRPSASPASARRSSTSRTPS